MIEALASLGLAETVAAVAAAAVLAWLAAGVVLAWIRRTVVRLTFRHLGFGLLTGAAGWAIERFGGVVGVVEAGLAFAVTLVGTLG